MKILQTNEITQCDFCENNDIDKNIFICEICGKDFCENHGDIFVANDTHKINCLIPRLNICDECFEKIKQKSTKRMNERLKNE